MGSCADDCYVYLRNLLLLLKSGYSWVLTVNPVYNVIINVRNIIFHEAFNWGCMTYACVFALVSVVVGVIVFHKNQDKFILYI